jgi:hypothetical protein
LGGAPDIQAFDADGVRVLSNPGRVLCSEAELEILCFLASRNGSKSFDKRPSSLAIFGNKLILAGAEFLVRTCACGGSGKAPIKSAVFAVLLGWVNLF